MVRLPRTSVSPLRAGSVSDGTSPLVIAGPSTTANGLDRAGPCGSVVADASGSAVVRVRRGTPVDV